MQRMAERSNQDKVQDFNQYLSARSRKNPGTRTLHGLHAYHVRAWRRRVSGDEPCAAAFKNMNEDRPFR